MSMLIEEPYNSDVVLQILLDAGKSRVLILGLEVGYVYYYFHLILAFALGYFFLCVALYHYSIRSRAKQNTEKKKTKPC